LGKVKLLKQIYFAWDIPTKVMEEYVKKGILLLKDWMPLSRIAFYVLVGFNTTPEQDLYRVETLRNLGVDPFVMPYEKSDPYQKRFARWVNHKAIFKSVKWKDYTTSLA